VSDDNQTFVPPSFQALYRDARGRWTMPPAHVATRSELCEDLAQHLTDHCHGVHIDIGADAQDVLHRCLEGLLQSESGMSPAEAHWVVVRLAELLNWPHPDLPVNG
jgi:hypothetical protein